MRSVLALILLTLVFTAAPAQAEPVTLALAALKAAAAKTWLGAFLYNLAGTVIFSVIAAKLMPKPKQPDIKREIAQPQSRQPYRFVYGFSRTMGSPLPLRVKGSVLYGCLLLNSRPSNGNFKLFLDKREATLVSGDIYDFAGTGAVIDFEDFPEQTGAAAPRVWIGRGDQTAPPALLLSEAPEFFDATDGWRGRTVLWLRLDAGPASQRQERWPSTPPSVEVEGEWSLVWDPRDEAQDPDDPTTWVYSDNQALCLLDALRTNPIRRYTADTLHMPSFIEAADVADEPITLFYDPPTPTEARYRVSGMLVWNGTEISDQVAPLVVAGGGDLVRIGGRLGYAAASYRASMLTVTDFAAEDGIDLQTVAPGREMPRAVRASYISPSRDWQSAEVPEIAVAGGVGLGDEGIMELDLSFVTSATQAMRLQQIMARRVALQRRLTLTLFPEAFDVVAGATVTFAMPAPLTRLNGVWFVEVANPGVWAGGDDGEVYMRVPVTLRQHAESIYTWIPATDEIEMLAAAEFTPITDRALDPPTDLQAEGASVDVTPVIDFDFLPSPAAAILSYDWEWRLSWGDWVSGGSLPVDTLVGGRVVGRLTVASGGIDHDIRVRANGGGRQSVWVTVTDIAVPFTVVDAGTY